MPPVPKTEVARVSETPQTSLYRTEDAYDRFFLH
jgi:hypothetical protein